MVRGVGVLILLIVKIMGLPKYKHNDITADCNVVFRAPIYNESGRYCCTRNWYYDGHGPVLMGLLGATPEWFEVAGAVYAEDDDNGFA